MTQLPNPPTFPEAGTRSKTLAIGIVTAIVMALVAGAAVVAHAHAPRHAEMTLVPPSYADALKQAEAEDMAKGVTPEMAVALRAKGIADPAAKPDQRGQF